MDLLNIPRNGEIVITNQGNEYRIGRPRVYKLDGQYVMIFTKGSTSGEYFPGVAYSTDGIHWVRNDAEFGMRLSDQGWDSQTLCYPALIQQKEKILMFYNGNGMGADGFGLAEMPGRLG
jgi:predicted GH43/DUF377 family glycosyl hydrolase